MLIISNPKTIKDKWLNAIQTVYRLYYNMSSNYSNPKPEQVFCNLVNKDCDKCIYKTFSLSKSYYHQTLHPCYMHYLAYTNWPYIGSKRLAAFLQFYKNLYTIVQEHDGRAMHKWSDPVVNLLIKRANKEAWDKWVKVTY